ncbi:hypothetical protein HNP37_001274 [Flavobacterium nitrogenifigens]|uniref:Uncharacterized protein n=2 Tax=Flavobacterium TaxID=237 RepID=A0A7W7IVL6_9FLAO|nr:MULTISPECIES: hypothetical protein [Flavobacterium]MBB4801235.1 hypothetical protein [Flavobacterium nitrogenifigens]MBB6385017.1 hypothetical protein [Flavobacterium notoginsengisoli]
MKRKQFLVLKFSEVILKIDIIMIKRCLLFLMFIFSFKGISQKINCKEVHTGKFELNSEISGKTEILRTEKHQIETNTFMNVKVQYDVFWLDECSYELRNRKLISGTSKYAGQPTDVFKVQILRISNNKIYVKTSANFTDQSFESAIDIIK